MLQSNDLLNVTVLIADENGCHVWLSRVRKAYLHGLQHQCLQHFQLFLHAEIEKLLLSISTLERLKL